MVDNNLHFIKLNEENKSEYLSLKVDESQKNFIETPERSLRDMETKAWNIPWVIECIYIGNHMIGYAMHGINKYNDVWLDRFMIDKRFQNKGYGFLALQKIIPMLKSIYSKRHRILLSVEPDNIVAIKLYEKFGFQLTGEIEDNESVMGLCE